MKRKQLFNLLKIVVSIALIAWIVRGIDLPALWSVLRGAKFGWWAVALGFALAGVLARVARWRTLLSALGVRVPFAELAQIYFIGFLFNNLLPSGLGGDAVRMMELNRHSSRAGDAVTSVLVDRMVGLFGSLSLALIALVFRWNAVPRELAWVALGAAIGLAGVLFLLIDASAYNTLRKIGLVRRVTDVKFVRGLFESFQDYSLPTLARAYGFSLLLGGALIAMNASIGAALGAEVSPVHYLVFVPLASMVLVLPISFAGLGVRESAYVFLFGQVGVPQEVAFSMSLMVYFTGNAIPGLMGGMVYLWRGARAMKMNNEK